MRGKIKTLFCKKSLNNAKEEKNYVQKLILELKAVFVMIPLLKEYHEEKNLVKLPREHIQIISNLLESDSKELLENEFFPEIKEYLLKIVKGEGMLILDDVFYSKAKVVEKFCYSLLDETYFVQKTF